MTTTNEKQALTNEAIEYILRYSTAENGDGLMPISFIADANIGLAPRHQDAIAQLENAGLHVYRFNGELIVSLRRRTTMTWAGTSGRCYRWNSKNDPSCPWRR